MGGVWHVLTRRKVLDESSDILKHNRLSRQLGTGDLVALGVGSTLGLGVYVLAGHVAKEAAGPSVVLSFLIAALASLFAGLCYAEFGARVPRAGSAYVYSYVCVGEFIAFIIGWNLILEYIIGSASVSRGISLYLDTLLNDTLKTTFRDIAPINVFFMSDYFDLLAFGVAFFFGVILAFGMKESALFNNIFTIFNICIILFVIIAGSIKADTGNWNIAPETIPEGVHAGTGGFFPFGFAGTLKGAATCFFGFVGFDCIATTGEEVHNPKRAIPLSILASLGIIFLAYFGISTVLTLMWPYYLQDEDAPIPFVFGQVGWEWAKWIVAIGGIFGLLSSLFGSIFPLPRILYAMASDGLVFKCFGTISPRFKSPVMGTIFASLLTGTLAGLFELSHLVNMMSIGTLMAYTIVAACVLLLRFERDSPPLKGEVQQHESSYLVSGEKFSFSRTLKQLFNCSLGSDPSRLSSFIVGSLITLYCAFCIAFSLCIIYSIDELTEGTVWSVVLTSLFGAFMLLCMLFISLQPRSKTKLSFQVPLVPLIPCISMFVNIYLMLMLDVYTWIRFGIWMAIGIPIYIISLYLYDRGGNYLMYAQKTSIRSHISGNLNYAFENLNECQERPTSFTSPEQDKPTDINQNGYYGNGHLPHEVPVVTQKLQNKEDEIIKCDDIDEISNERNLLRESFIEIEKLDQVLKEEEEASQYSTLEAVGEEPPVQIIPLHSEYPPEPDIPPTDASLLISAGDGDGSLCVSSEQNVVVLVHRENDVQPAEVQRSSSQLSISKVQPNENDEQDNVSATNEDISFGEKSTASTLSLEDHPTSLEEAKEPPVFIPAAPPMDEAYFTTRTLPVVRRNFPKPKLDKPRYEPEPDYDDVELRNPSKDTNKDDDSEESGTDSKKSFMNKLNTLLKTQPAARFSKNKKLKRSSSSNTLENSGLQSQDNFRELRDMQRSEPSLNAALKKDIIQYKSREPIQTSVLHTTPLVRRTPSPKPISNSNSRKTSTSNKTDDSNQPDEEEEKVEVKTLSKKDLKLKLESILSFGPPAANPRISKRLTEIHADDNISVEESGADKTRNSMISNASNELKRPKGIDNYTNTMKLQRARFGDVLKSIQLNTQRASSTGDEPADSLGKEEPTADIV